MVSKDKQCLALQENSCNKNTLDFFFRVLRQTVPPSIFIQMAISTWTEIAVQQQKLSLASAKPQPIPTAICHSHYHHLLSSFTAPALPALAEPELLAHHRRGQEGHRSSAFAPQRWTTASWLSRHSILPGAL